MRRTDFHYDLPPERIAEYPCAQRGDSRLLCLDGETGTLEDRLFGDLPELMQPGDLLVLNDTRVLRARLLGHKETGGKVEILLERVVGDRGALAQIRSRRSVRVGTRIRLEGGERLEVIGSHQGFWDLYFDDARRVGEILEIRGRVPLPPYIRRAAEHADPERYQTVYARRPGAVAAPTAGLHFDQDLLARLVRQGIDLGFVTLHIGAGTFRPVRVERIEEHAMHPEYAEVSSQICEQVRAARRRGGRVVAVGTTSVRALEAASASGELRAFRGETDIFIYPGYRFRSVDALVTNFHLPESTLLMLVCAFAGRERVLAAYRHAIAQCYRFYSFGDAMFVTPHAV